MIQRCVRSGLVALAAAGAGCFDSDEVFKVAATTTGADTTTTLPPTTTTSTTDPTTSTGSTGDPDVTCRDAIDCIFECAAAVQAQTMDPNYEPDLSCFLECEEQLTVPEAKKLLLLANCASEQCAMMGDCGSSDTTSTSSGGSSDSTDDGPPPPEGPLTPCLMCIFVLMLDEDFEGCAEFAMACE